MIHESFVARVLAAPPNILLGQALPPINPDKVDFSLAKQNASCSPLMWVPSGLLSYENYLHPDTDYMHVVWGSSEDGRSYFPGMSTADGGTGWV